MTRIRAAFAQFFPEFGVRTTNTEMIRRLGREAKQNGGVDLLVYPELCTTGYDFIDTAEARDLAQPFFEGDESALAKELAADLDAVVVLGYAERAGDLVYNSALMALPDGTTHNYRKLHLFSRETEIFAPGDTAPRAVETPAGRLGMMICFDWFFPETARLLALDGAQVIVHPSNLVMPYCQKAMYARCVENRVFAITTNRIGEESRAGRTLNFTGQSQIMDPQGNVLAHASANGEAVGFAEFDPDDADNKQLNEYNDVFAMRRTSMYGPLANE